MCPVTRASDPVRRVQRAYPQLYLACHVHHTTRRRDHGLSDRDSSVLAHLVELSPLTAGPLAAPPSAVPARQRAAAVRGLELLAAAARSVMLRARGARRASRVE